jgi:hypothetical protein
LIGCYQYWLLESYRYGTVNTIFMLDGMDMFLNLL